VPWCAARGALERRVGVMAEEPLHFPFDRDGWRHVLVRREGDVCLVERTNLRVEPPSVHWEVIVVQHRPAETTRSGRSYPARESYPAAGKWGEQGWTFTERVQADAKMAAVTLRASRRATRAPHPARGHRGGSSA
jgi:hypothetical protein